MEPNDEGGLPAREKPGRKVEINDAAAGSEFYFEVRLDGRS
jgi:hypothetical protein